MRVKRALQMVLACFQKGGEKFCVTAHLMMKRRELHFLEVRIIISFC